MAALLLRFHSAVSVGREQHAWQLLALSIVSVCGFCAVAHVLVCGISTFFCPVFGKKFNLISALFIHQVLTLSQKIDSREGSF